MNYADIKSKIKSILAEDAEAHKDDERFSFKDTFQYRQLTIVVGFVIGIITVMAIKPELLTSPLNFENMTIMSFATYALVGYIFVIACEGAGMFVMDRAEIIYNDLSQHAKIPKIIGDSLIVIMLIGFLAFKLLYPVVFGGIR